MCLSTCASWPIIFQWRKYIFYWNSNIFWQILYVWTMCIIYCLLFILQACSDKWLCNSRRKDTLLMMTKLFAGSASLSRRLLNSGHLLHFLCCTICTMHLLQIFRPKLPIIEPQLQLFPFLATDCHHHCSNLSYSLSLLHLCNYTCKYHHQMQEWINRQIVLKWSFLRWLVFARGENHDMPLIVMMSNANNSSSSIVHYRKVGGGCGFAKSALDSQGTKPLHN